MKKIYLGATIVMQLCMRQNGLIMNLNLDVHYALLLYQKLNSGLEKVVKTIRIMNKYLHGISERHWSCFRYSSSDIRHNSLGIHVFNESH